MDNYDANVSTSGKTVTITIQSNRTILDDEISLFSENDEVEITIVDKMIKEFNRISNGLIIDYNYEILDKKNITVEIFFKQCFSKFGETQRYVNYKVTYNETNKSIEAVLNKNPIGLKIPTDCDCFPFKDITITNTKVDNVNKTVITALSKKDISSYKNFNMIVDFTKKLIYNNYMNIDNYINITKLNNNNIVYNQKCYV
jgi:hypothetical protein